MFSAPRGPRRSESWGVSTPSSLLTTSPPPNSSCARLVLTGTTPGLNRRLSTESQLPSYAGLETTGAADEPPPAGVTQYESSTAARSSPSSPSLPPSSLPWVTVRGHGELGQGGRAGDTPYSSSAWSARCHSNVCN